MLDIEWIIFLSFPIDESPFNIKLKSKLGLFFLQNVKVFILKNVETKCSDILEKSISPRTNFPSKNWSLICYP